MKKFITLIFVSTLIAPFALVGCSSSDAGEEKAAPVDKEKDAQTQKTGASASPTQD